MYIVKQQINGRDYFYIRRSERKGNQVKSKLVCYGGKTREIAEKKLEELKSGEKVTKEKDFEPTPISIEELANFCKKKGFVFRSSDIYGGLAGFWDFAPLGVELFNNLKQDWWNYFVRSRENMEGIEASIISHPKTWKVSGHLDNFNDLMIYCEKNKKWIRVDHLIEEVLDINVEGLEEAKILELVNKNKNKFSEKGYFLGEELKKLNLMFATNIGPVEDESGRAYLRGETAQGMFLDFKIVQQTSRQQLPFGIAQIGRCFRNEIAPRDFLFRVREFHIGEFEFFIHPDEKKCNLLNENHLNLIFNLLNEETQKLGKSDLTKISIGDLLESKKLGEWHAYWLAEQIKWFYSLGLKEIKIREHTKDELSHYSSATFDIDYQYSFGSKEVAGIANRGQYDLTQHQEGSKESMEIFDEKTKSKIVPRVIEPTFGMERVFLAVLTKAYCFDEARKNVVLRLHPKLAPVKAAVFPIIKKPEYEKFAQEIVDDLKKEWNVVYDRSGSIGRRYARNDEIGTPMCITIDEKTPEDNSVTIRDRDTSEQIRAKIKDLREIVRQVVSGEDLLRFGKKVETRVKK
ncbi:MAG: glycine--tRNA ligase [Nanoarchaeota archaeon]|nr:glycine--tRNA ligase [Nanoarchaeota archaeon]